MIVFVPLLSEEVNHSPKGGDMKTYTREDVISLLLVVSALSKSIATKMQMMDGGDKDGKDE